MVASVPKSILRLAGVLGAETRAYTSGSVAESSGSAWQGAKTSASVDILAPTQLYLVHNLNSYYTTLES